MYTRREWPLLPEALRVRTLRGTIGLRDFITRESAVFFLHDLANARGTFACLRVSCGRHFVALPTRSRAGGWSRNGRRLLVIIICC